jgi:hypothetical protein
MVTERLSETFAKPHSIIPREPEPDHQESTTPASECAQPSPPPKSKLFPKLSSIAVHSEPSDPRPAFIADPSVLKVPEFSAAFADCRVVVRALRCADIEMSDRVAIILRPPRLDRVVEAIATFETIFIVGPDVSTQFEFHGHPSIRIRHFPEMESTFRFIRCLIDPRTGLYLRDHESLHELLLSFFPSVSRSLAQHMLRKGNPISDANFSFEEFPSMNVYVFTVLLDAQTLAFQRHVAQKRSRKAPGKRMPVEGIPAHVPGLSKVPAPRPGTISRSEN